jgi:integrase
MPIKLYQRGKVWHYRGTVAGRRLRGSCQTTNKDIAARQVAEIETKQWKYNFDGPQAVITFAQVALMYRAAGKPTRFLALIEDYWKDTLVKDINQGAIRKMAIDLYPRAATATRNRQAIVPCQAIINYAADSELCPHIKVKRFKTEKKVKEPFTLEWVTTFRQYASPQLGALALFMFVTGARVSEALRVQWDDIDFKAKTVTIRKTKIGEGRIGSTFRDRMTHQFYRVR